MTLDVKVPENKPSENNADPLAKNEDVVGDNINISENDTKDKFVEIKNGLEKPVSQINDDINSFLNSFEDTPNDDKMIEDKIHTENDLKTNDEMAEAISTGKMHTEKGLKIDDEFGQAIKKDEIHPENGITIDHKPADQVIAIENNDKGDQDAFKSGDTLTKNIVTEIPQKDCNSTKVCSEETDKSDVANENGPQDETKKTDVADENAPQDETKKTDVADDTINDPLAEITTTENDQKDQKTDTDDNNPLAEVNTRENDESTAEDDINHSKTKVSNDHPTDLIKTKESLSLDGSQVEDKINNQKTDNPKDNNGKDKTKLEDKCDKSDVADDPLVEVNEDSSCNVEDGKGKVNDPKMAVVGIPVVESDNSDPKEIQAPILENEHKNIECIETDGSIFKEKSQEMDDEEECSKADTSKDIEDPNGNQEVQIETIGLDNEKKVELKEEGPKKVEQNEEGPKVLMFAPFSSCELSDSDIEELDANEKFNNDIEKIGSDIESILGSDVEESILGSELEESILGSEVEESILGSEGESILGLDSDDHYDYDNDKEERSKTTKRKSRSPQMADVDDSDSDIQEILDVPGGEEPKKKRRKVKTATGNSNADEIRIGSSGDDSEPQEWYPVLPSGSKRARKEVNYNEMGNKKLKIGQNESPQVQPDKCFVCKQRTAEVKTIELPTVGVKEEVAVENPDIRIDGDDNAALQFKLTNFTIFDKSGHVVPIFAPDIINKYKKLYFSGKIQSIVADDDDIEGVNVFEAGPIVEWTNRAGHDTSKEDIMLNTKVNDRDVEYHLVSPSDDYREVYESVYRMVYMSNKIITELCDRNDRNELMEYGELLEFVANLKSPVLQGKQLQPIDEETLQMNADFLVTQVSTFEEAGDVGEDLTIVGMPCIKHLSEMAGVDRKRQEPPTPHNRAGHVPRITAQPPVTNVKAVTTPLVAQLFESKFREQMRTNDNKGKGQKVCTCRACQSPNCGRCDRCKAMISFGGETPDGQMTCYNRQCFNSADPVDLEGDDSDDEDVGRKKKALPRTKVAFSGKAQKVGNKEYYPSVNVETKSEVMQIKPGNYVLVKSHHNSSDANGLKAACYIGRVIYLYKDQQFGNLGHVQWMARGEDTVLGKTGDPKEYFLVAECETISLGDVLKVLFIEHRPITDVARWREVGGTIEAISIQDVDGVASDGWWRLRYWPEFGRFDYPEDADDEVEMVEGERCKLCCQAKNKAELAKTVIEEKRVRINTEWFNVGDFMFLEDQTVEYKIKPKKPKVVFKDKKKDPKKYPEYYRKQEAYHGDHHATYDPLQVLRVEKVSRELGKAKLKLRKLYRPENTSLTLEEARTKPLSCLYWTNEFAVLREDDLKDRCCGKAWINGQSGGDVEEMRLWTDKEKDRFFITEEFDSEKMCFSNLNQEMSEKLAKAAELAPTTPEVTPLPSLDIFAGCGGLSVGLHNSGIANPKWAIEFWKPAADAFQLNFPGCKVLNNDCNKLLEAQLKGRNTLLPKKGEIEMMSGGPPCQGFSLLNMFKEQEYSKFKNSLVPTYLSYADYYRPKFFLLENVRNLVANEDGMVLKLCLSTMVRLGYQTSFGVFQAGHFGVAQTRRRLFIIAAAPGQKLPWFPTPEYCFYGPLFSEIDVDGRKFTSTNSRPGSARRGVTTWDAISDLPPIKTGSCNDEMTYSHTTKDGEFHDGLPKSHLQHMYRAGQGDKLINHVCKTVSDLVNTRISYIPTEPGSDWRDLPNMEVVYGENGQSTRKLRYLYKKPIDKDNVKRGVCSCCLSTKEKFVVCDRDDKQPQTLMPWSLPHTADRKNHWAGVFGRVPWEGFFKTTITDPEPLGKQGMVLHPDQDRLVSVRECARSQGFPDHFRFSGTILDKHRQIGNAVPPPMGKGIGLEIRKALVARMPKEEEKL